MGRATDDALSAHGVGGWAAEGRTTQSWATASGGARPCGVTGGVVGGVGGRYGVVTPPKEHLLREEVRLVGTSMFLT